MRVGRGVIGRDPRGDTIPVKQNSPITGPKKYPKSSPCNTIMENLYRNKMKFAAMVWRPSLYVLF